MNVLAIQTDIVWEDREANYEAVHRLIAQAAPAPDTLVVLPEMFATGFSMNVPAVAEAPPGPTLKFVESMARQYKVCMVAGLVQYDDAGRPRNRCVAVGPDGSTLATYTKIKPAWIGPEGDHYPGGESVTRFSWLDSVISPFICYDLRFPEVFRRAAARWKPAVYTVIACWPAARVHHWVRLLQARAIENQAYVIGVNRAGRDPDYEFGGRSVVVDYHGEIIAEAGTAEACAKARLDLVALREYRAACPFLADMEPAMAS